MIYKIFASRTVFVAFFALTSFQVAVTGLAAQSMPSPKQEKLLNGLKVLMWSDPKADKVSVKLRIHSGSAFDPQGREGVMKLLSDNLFPNDAANDFFTEDLGGSLEIRTTYDYIQINASAKPESFLTMMETIATAVANPAIDKETTARLRAALLEKVSKAQDDPAYVADRAVAARLFGTFPYGRPIWGTPDSVQKIEYADLLDARRRFLTADNATIAITGNFDRALALKALRRYFGGWQKSDRRVPSTFRQPDEPSPAVLDVPSPKPGVAEIRYALRGVSRSGKDLGASLIFAQIMQERLRTRVPAGHTGDLFVRNEYRTLPGIIVIGFSSSNNIQGDKIEANALVGKAISGPISEAEFAAAKAAARSSWSAKEPAYFWLDSDTYQIADPNADASVIDNVSIADVNSYAGRLHTLPIVTVLVNTPIKAN
jgi:predicted Zn-dependent peptidase